MQIRYQAWNGEEENNICAEPEHVPQILPGLSIPRVITPTPYLQCSVRPCRASALGGANEEPITRHRGRFRCTWMLRTVQSVRIRVGASRPLEQHSFFDITKCSTRRYTRFDRAEAGKEDKKFTGSILRILPSPTDGLVADLGVEDCFPFLAKGEFLSAGAGMI